VVCIYHIHNDKSWWRGAAGNWWRTQCNGLTRGGSVVWRHGDVIACLTRAMRNSVLKMDQQWRLLKSVHEVLVQPARPGVCY
jgi:hypothetical protein